MNAAIDDKAGLRAAEKFDADVRSGEFGLAVSVAGFLVDAVANPTQALRDAEQIDANVRSGKQGKVLKTIGEGVEAISDTIDRWRGRRH